MLLRSLSAYFRRRRAAQMLKDITLGQFFPGSSILHKADPRMKIILAVIYIVFLFLFFAIICIFFGIFDF